MLRIICIFLSALIFCSPTFGEYFEQLEGVDPQNIPTKIQVKTIKKDDSDFWAFYAKGVMNAPVESVLSILRNVEQSHEWTPALIIKKTLKNISDTEAITYNDNDIIWPATDRDIVLLNKLHLDKKNKLLVIKAQSLEDGEEYYKEREDRIRAFMHLGLIGMAPLNTQQTWMEIYIHVDPRGSLPAWLVNFYQKNWPKDFIKALEKRAIEKPEKLNGGINKVLHSLSQLSIPQVRPIKLDKEE